MAKIELKQPIVEEISANIKDAAKKIVWGKTLNEGQTCVAPDFVLEDEAMQLKFENEQYDIVVANILADVIIPIAGIVDRFLKLGGTFISSGISPLRACGVAKNGV